MVFCLVFALLLGCGFAEDKVDACLFFFILYSGYGLVLLSLSGVFVWLVEVWLNLSGCGLVSSVLSGAFGLK